jgi:peptidoglycan-N-acetylglucosamine deacetylase
MAAITQPGILLTFDDHFIDEWLDADELFRRFSARVTFFVSEFDTLSPGRIDGLRRLREAGHAVGCHGRRHLDAVEFCRRHSKAEYLRTEILPVIEAMQKAHLPPVAFAYPMSSNNAETDRLLLDHFHHLRSGAFLENGRRLRELDRIFTPIAQLVRTGCLYGKSIDTVSGFDWTDIADALARARENGELVTFYSHNIACKASRNHINPADLETILRLAVRQELSFYTFDDLPERNSAVNSAGR